MAKEPPPPSAFDSVQDKDSLLKQGYVSPELESHTSAINAAVKTIDKMSIEHSVQLHSTVHREHKLLHHEQTSVTTCMLSQTVH